MIRDLGTVRPGTTLYLPFHAFDSNDPSASTTISGLAVTDIEVYKDGGVTQRASDNGYALLDTDGIDFDGITGINAVSIDLADNTTAGFWAAGSQYWVVIASVTIDAATVNFILATFRIGYVGAVLDTTIATLSHQTKFTLTTGPAENDALVGCPVVIHDVASGVQVSHGIVRSYVGATKTVELVAAPTFTIATTDNVSVMPRSDLGLILHKLDKLIGAAVVGELNTTMHEDSVLAHLAHNDRSTGTGTGIEGGFDRATDSLEAIRLAVDSVQADTDNIQTRLPAALVSGRMDSNMQAAANDVITASVIATGAIDADAIADNAIDAGAIAANAITSAKIATDAIGAAQLADGAITAATFAAGAIDATAIANGAIDAATFAAGAIDAAALAADAGTEIGTAVWATATRSLTVLDEDSTTLDLDATIRAAVGLASANLDTQLSAIDDFLDTEITAIKAVTDKLDTMIVGDTGTGAGQYQFDRWALDSVWDVTLAAHLATGSTGNALNAAGAAGDPWSTALPGAYGAGTAGKIVGDNLNATISSRSSHSAADVWTSATRSLTVLDEDSTTLDLDATIRAAVGLASANLDTQLDALPTAAEVWTSGTRTLTAATNITSTGGTVPITAGGLVNSDMAAISTDTAAADNAEKYFDGTGYGEILQRTTIATVNSQDNFTLTAGSADNNAYQFCLVVVEDQVTAAQKGVRAVESYVGSTKTVTLASNPAFPFTVAVGDIITIIADLSIKPISEGFVLVDSQGRIRATDSGGSTIIWSTVDGIDTKIGTPSNLGGGATLSFNLSDIEAQTDDIGAAGAGLTAAGITAAGVRSAVGLASANLDTQLDALPTAAENAAALLDLSNGVETGVTPRQALRLLAAAIGGELAGAATTTVTIKAANNNGTTRVTATVDASGNRSALTLNL